MSTPRLQSALSLEQWQQLERDLFDEAGLALTTARDYARANYLPPVAFVLISCLKVLSSLPGNVTFDAGVGKGSLNLFAALVGGPGAGKDTLMLGVNQAVRVACDGRVLNPMELPLGSGEGIAETFKLEEGQSVSSPVLFGSSEIGQVETLMNRQGSTLRSNLLMIYSGNALGFTNRGEKFTVPAHSYTAGLWVGVQPDKAGALLDGQDDGLSHRFVWTELVDPTRIMPEVAPDALQTVDVPADILNGVPVTFHADIVRETRAMNDIRLRYGVQGKNAGHRHQTRLKLAAGLALLRSAAVVDLEDWRRAGVLMDYSDQIQNDCLAHLKGQRDQEAAERLEQRERAEERVQSDRLARNRHKVLETLKNGDVVTRTEVLQSIHSRQRDVMAAVLETLEMEGMITVTEGENGRKFLQRNKDYAGEWL